MTVYVHLAARAELFLIRVSFMRYVLTRYVLTRFGEIPHSFEDVVPEGWTESMCAQDATGPPKKD